MCTNAATTTTEHRFQPTCSIKIYSAYIIAAETGHAELLCRNHRTSVHRIEVEIVRNVEEHDVELPYALASMAFVQQHHQLFAVEQHGEKPGMRHGSVVQGTAGQACQGQPQHFFFEPSSPSWSPRGPNKQTKTAEQHGWEQGRAGKHHHVRDKPQPLIALPPPWSTLDLKRSSKVRSSPSRKHRRSCLLQR